MIKDNNNLRELLSYSETKVIFCLLDIDNFSIYNETHGFESGDLILEKVHCLIKTFPTINNVIKLNSDEYVFSCLGNFNDNKDLVLSFLENIQSNFKITVSIGIVEFIEKNFKSEDLFIRLKNNVLTAKNNGKNKIFIN